MKINGNNMKIYNEFKIPKSIRDLKNIIDYVNTNFIERKKDSLVSVEQSLRKQLANDQIEEARKNYSDNLISFENNLKSEINSESEIFKAIFNQNNIELKNYLIDDYLIYYLINYYTTNNVDYSLNDKILSFLKLIIKSKLSNTHNHLYEFTGEPNEFVKIILFSQVDIREIKYFLDIFIEMSRFCENIEGRMIKVLNENKISYENSERNKGYTSIVNISFFNIFESLTRAILLDGIELKKKDQVKFNEYLNALPSIEASLQKLNSKLYLYSKELFSLKCIVKIYQNNNLNYEQFETNFERIMHNLLQQSEEFYAENFNRLYNLILDLLKILDEVFEEKNEAYVELLFFIFRAQHRNIYDNEIRIKLLVDFFKSKSLLIKSKIFLSETLKDMKPEIPSGKKGENDCIRNFMNLEIKKFEKFRPIIDICQKTVNPEFNEILLFFLEGQCQSYFKSILQKYDNKYEEKCCEELLLKLSLSYLKKAKEYLYQNKDKSDNNLLKLFAIAYIKTYCYYYVEINFTKKDNCSWVEINKVFDDKNNESLRKVINLYFWRLYFRKFENFEQFLQFNFGERDIAIYKELQDQIEKERQKNNSKYIFKESFVTNNQGDTYDKLILYYEQNNEINYNDINTNFDLYYCFFVNKIISYLYDKKLKSEIIKTMKNIYDLSSQQIKMNVEGKKLYEYLLNNTKYEEKIVNKISDKPLTQVEFEILLYSFRYIFNSQINNKNCFYNDILKANTANFIDNHFIPGSFPSENEYLKSYNKLKERFKHNIERGYYICKDCGYFYEIPNCGFPMSVSICPNKHQIGGENHHCIKKDLRVFYNEESLNKVKQNSSYNPVSVKNFE